MSDDFAVKGTFLGRSSKINSGWGRIEPLLEATPDGWREIRKSASRFPDEGMVFSVERNVIYEGQDALWNFEIEVNDRHNLEKRGDRFRTRGARKPVEVIDLSKLSLEQARCAVVETGLELVARPYDPVIAVAGGLAVRLPLVLDNGRWIPEMGTSLEKVQTRRLSQAAFAGETFHGRHFLLPWKDVGEFDVVVDWSTDIVFLHDLLKRLKKLSPVGNFQEQLPLAKATIESVTRFVRAAALLPSSRPEIAAISRRFQAFLPALANNVSDIDEIVSSLETLHPVAKRISEDLETARQRIDAEIRQDLEQRVRSEMATVHETLLNEDARLRERLDETQTQLTIVTNDLRQAETKLTHLHQSFDAEVARIQVALGSNPSLFTSQSRAFAERLANATDINVRELYPTELAPWAAECSMPCESLDLSDLCGRLSQIAKSRQLNADHLTGLDALARAGELVVLMGSEGQLYLDAYCHAITGGARRTIILDPTTLSAEDLWRTPGSGASTSLAHAWTAALAHRAHMVVCVLEQIEASPFDIWLNSFASLVRRPSRPPNLLFIAHIVGQAVDAKRASLHGVRNLIVPSTDVIGDAGAASIMNALGLSNDPPT